MIYIYRHRQQYMCHYMHDYDMHCVRFDICIPHRNSMQLSWMKQHLQLRNSSIQTERY